MHKYKYFAWCVHIHIHIYMHILQRSFRNMHMSLSSVLPSNRNRAGKCKRAPSPRLTCNHNWQQARAVASCSTRAKPLACALPHANENRVPSLVTRRAPRLRFNRIIHANGVILNENLVEFPFVECYSSDSICARPLLATTVSQNKHLGASFCYILLHGERELRNMVQPRQQ